MDQTSYGGFSIALRLGQALQLQPFKSKREEVLSSFLAKYSTVGKDVLALLEALGLYYNDRPDAFLKSVDDVATHIAKSLGIKTISARPGCPLSSSYSEHGTLQLENAVIFIRGYRKLLRAEAAGRSREEATFQSGVTEDLIMTTIKSCTEYEFQMLCCVIQGGCNNIVVGLGTVEEFLAVISPAALASYLEEGNDLELAITVACGEGSPRAALERDPTLNAEMSDEVFDGLAVGGTPARATGGSSDDLLLRFRSSVAPGGFLGASPSVGFRKTVEVEVEDEIGDDDAYCVKAFSSDVKVHAESDDLEERSIKARRLEAEEVGDVPSTAGGGTTRGGRRKHPCMYGAKCTRKNPDHWAKYDHPPEHPWYGGIKVVPSPIDASGGDVEDDVPLPAPPLDPKDHAIKGISPLRVMPLHEFVFVDGATGTHKMKNCGEGTYSCNCPVWRFQTRGTNSRTCKHLREYLGEEFERVRCSEEGEYVGGGGAGGGVPAANAGAGGGVQKVAPVPAGKKHAMKGVLLANKATEGVGYEGSWLSEKLDGIRCFWDGTRLMTRNGNEIFAPEWFMACLPKDHQLDGELFGGRKKFQYTSGIYRSSISHPGWKTLTYEVFDIPSLSDKPFEARQHAMETMFPANRDKTAAPDSSHVHVVTQIKCTGKAFLDAELKRIEDLGGEGLMVRQPGSKYVFSRSNTLLKVKSTEEQEARVIAYDAGKGRLVASVGALRCELANKKQFSVGSGLNDAIRAKPPPIGSVVTVRYQELTDGGIPRFPVYVGVRHDIDWPPADGGARRTK